MTALWFIYRQRKRKGSEDVTRSYTEDELIDMLRSRGLARMEARIGHENGQRFMQPDVEYLRALDRFEQSINTSVKTSATMDPSQIHPEGMPAVHIRLLLLLTSDR